MGVKVLLDANAYSYYANGGEELASIVASADEVMISAIVLGELLAGFRQGSRFNRNVVSLQAFLASPRVSVASVGAATAERYGEIAAALRAKGRPIPANDIWIAAHAMETGADLVSADAHFAHVDGLAWTRVTAG